jgi:S-adenosylmethionine hydrolase
MPEILTRPITTPAAQRAARRSAAGRAAWRSPLVSLTTDFGARDPSAAICRGVILQIAPRARVLDISHEVEKYSVLDAALLLWCALPYLPLGVHLAVVDPGVGTERLAVGIETARGDLLVGPDNGLLRPAAERLGGIRAAHVLENPDYRLPALSASFHGRDVFAPAAAHLALGVPLADFGRPIDPAALVPLELPVPLVRPGLLETEIVYVDTFGNLKLAGGSSDLAAAVGPLQPGLSLTVSCSNVAGTVDRVEGLVEEQVPWATTFASVPVGRPLLYEDSYGRLCWADNQGNLAARLGLRRGCRVSVRRA